MAREDRACAQSKGVCTFSERRRRETRQLGAGDAVRTGPAREHHRSDERDRSSLGTREREDGEDSYERHRERGGNLGDAVKKEPDWRRVGAERSEDEAKEDASKTGCRCDEEGHPSAGEDQAQQIATACVGPKRKRPTGRIRRRLLAQIEDDVEGLVRRKAFAESRESEK